MNTAKYIPNAATLAETDSKEFAGASNRYPLRVFLGFRRPNVRQCVPFASSEFREVRPCLRKARGISSAFIARIVVLNLIVFPPTDGAQLVAARIPARQS